MKHFLIILFLITFSLFLFCQEDESPANNKDTPSRTGIISDPSWGFKFHTPLGWKAQKDASGAILGHDKVDGMILVYPHSARNSKEMEQQMQEGLKEDVNYLTPSEEIKSSGKNVIVGDYEGMYNGEQVKGKGIGTLSPHGGGAYIIAISTPEKFSKDISKAADTIAKSMQYVKPNVSSDLLQVFAGTWTNYTKSTKTFITKTNKLLKLYFGRA